MALKIIKAGKSNQTKTGGHTDAPMPFIDRLTIVIVPAEKHASAIHCALWECLTTDPTFKNYPKGLTGQFKRAARLLLPSTELLPPRKRPLLQYAYEAGNPGKALKIRLDFVPVDLGTSGLTELHAWLHFMPDGWDYVVKHGHVTRIDVAVDFKDVAVADFLFLPKQGATSKQWRSTGALTGYTHGKRKGNQTAVYDRKQKRIDLKQNAVGKEGTRVERRLRNPDVSLAKMHELKNPFADIEMVAHPKGCPPFEMKQPYIWELLKHAVAAKGLPAALAVLPKKKKAMYRAYFKPALKAWWDPEAIWARWPEALHECKPLWYIAPLK